MKVLCSPCSAAARQAPTRLTQANGYKATAKMQFLFFFSFLGLHSLQVSTKISFSIKVVPDCPWVLQKPGLPHLCFFFSSLANATDTNMPVKSSFVFWSGFWSTLFSLQWFYLFVCLFFQFGIIALRRKWVHRTGIWIWRLTISLFFSHHRVGRKGSFSFSHLHLVWELV